MAQSETERFTGFAASYNAGRPGYPPQVVDCILEGLSDPSGLKVADLGAGTGLSSQLFAERGAMVFAIEPNASMRAKGASISGVTWRDGTGEKTGLEDSSVDVVTAFQAFHWFDHAASLVEMTRILRPGGRAAVLFYERDESDPFTHAYGDIVRRFATDETEERRARALQTFAQWPGWTHTQRHVIGGEHVLDEAGMAVRLESTSYLPHSGPEGDTVRAAIDELFRNNAKDGRVRLMLQTIIVVAEPK